MLNEAYLLPRLFGYLFDFPVYTKPQAHQPFLRWFCLSGCPAVLLPAGTRVVFAGRAWARWPTRLLGPGVAITIVRAAANIQASEPPEAMHWCAP